jgi:hypothetical protein
MLNEAMMSSAELHSSKAGAQDIGLDFSIVPPVLGVEVDRTWTLVSRVESNVGVPLRGWKKK